MSQTPTEDNRLYRLQVAQEDTPRFELTLEDEQIRFQSYNESFDTMATVFTLHEDDSTRINALIIENQIAASRMDQVLISSRSVKGNKLFLAVAVIVALITLIIFALVH